ncbi:MAG: WG repeat-containing protein [Tannerella sp.]|jgi:hypothetical protein|nr:WG repeat-containing protein [Tannerella sp.]
MGKTVFSAIKCITGIIFFTLCYNCSGGVSKQEIAREDIIPKEDKQSGKWGYVDEKGKEVLPFEYDHAVSFTDGLARVLLNGNYVSINKTGQKFETIFTLHGGLRKVISDGKCGYLNNTGDVIIPCKYDQIEDFYNEQGKTVNDYAKVQIGEKFGIVDKKGKEIVSCSYDEIRKSNGNMALVINDGKYGYFDNQTGLEVVPCKYDYGYEFSNDMALVMLNGKYGYIDKTGNETIPLMFGEAESFSKNGLAQVKLNNKKKYINKKGEDAKVDYLFKGEVNMNYVDKLIVTFALSEDKKTMSNIKIEIKDLQYTSTKDGNITTINIGSSTNYIQGIVKVNANDRYYNNISFGNSGITELHFTEGLNYATGMISYVHEHHTGSETIKIPLGRSEISFYKTGVYLAAPSSL